MAARVVVKAGQHPRRLAPLVAPLPELPESVSALRDGASGAVLPVQRCPEGLAFLLPELAAGAEAHFEPAEAAAPGDGQGVQVAERDGELELRVDGDLVTRYRFAGEGLARPYFWPLHGPGGLPVTRAYPMLPDAPGEARDHPHHRSLWVAYGELEGVDAWSEGRGHGFTVHSGFDAVTSGPVFGGFRERTRWVDAQGGELLQEVRELRLYRTPDDLRLLDLDLHWRFERRDPRGRRYNLGLVHVGDTKEAGLVAVRVASSLDAQADGTIENAWGGLGEAETWGRRAPWCDYSGPVQGQVVGIAAFDHPANLHFPCYWHVRNYGLMGSNPFGGENFTGSPLENGAMTFRPGDELRFRYRLIIHKGGAAQADIAARWFDFGFPPTVQVEG